MDGKHNDLSQKIDNLDTISLGLLISTRCKRKENFLLNPPNPKVIHEMREVKAMITLRSGKEVDLPTPKRTRTKD
ncbi:hypothetical protein AAG906_030858 [Vitis piasezkii]